MIPGAYEPRAPLHRNTPAAPQGHPAPPEGTRPSPDAADGVYVVAAPHQSTTWLGQSATILADLAVATGIVFAIVLVPVVIARILVWGVGVIGRALG